MAKTPYTNPEQHNVNQSQGPRNGNTGNAVKRRDFIKEKSGEWREAIAAVVMDALTRRGDGSKSKIDPAVEGLSSNTGLKNNRTADGSRLPRGARRPGTRLKP